MGREASPAELYALREFLYRTFESKEGFGPIDTTPKAASLFVPKYCFGEVNVVGPLPTSPLAFTLMYNTRVRNKRFLTKRLLTIHYYALDSDKRINISIGFNDTISRTHKETIDNIISSVKKSCFNEIVHITAVGDFYD